MLADIDCLFAALLIEWQGVKFQTRALHKAKVSVVSVFVFYLHTPQCPYKFVWHDFLLLGCL